jgi:hypothetical protein
MLAAGSERFHSAWVARAAGVTVRRLEDDAEHALASGAFDPALLPELPEGVQIGAEHTGPETDAWVANVPAEIGRLFRACLASVARRLNTGPGGALEEMFDHCIDTWRCTVPGCTSQTNLHAHHQRGVHAGLIRIAGRAPDDLVFELPLGRFRSGDRAA